MKRLTKKTSCCCKAFNAHSVFQHERRNVVLCTDKGSKTKYVYNNQSSDYLSNYRVDGGLISYDETRKCDYLLLNCEKKQSYFIELKGSDIISAVDQIDKSIDLLKNKLPGFSFFARIVLTRVNTHDLRDPRLEKLERKVNTLNGDLKKQSRFLEDIV